MLEKENFIECVLKITDKWSLKQCAYCDPGTMVSVEGMVDFKCIKCGKDMKPEYYLEEIAKIASFYRESINNKEI